MGEPAWSDGDLSDPHGKADKARRVRSMFSAIAPSYDLNNRLHSMWRDQAWRRRAVKVAGVKAGEVVLDVACGTGDLAMAFARVGAGAVLGVDFTHEMLTIAAEKNRKSHGAGVKPFYVAGDAMALPVAEASVDVVSIAFGIRNVSEPGKAIGEFWRVLKPGGRVVILEFSTPGNRVMRGLYHFYFTKVMPRTATLISGDKSGAYKYLPRSVDTFIDRGRMEGMMREAGFVETGQDVLTGGIAVIYCGVKR